MITLAKFPAWVCALSISACAALAGDDDVAVAIVCDSSGSMKDSVKGKGSTEPKWQIANRALLAIVARLEKVPATGGRKIQAGLFTFAGQGAREIVKPGPLDAAAMRAAIKDLGQPTSGTPLGNAVAEATRALTKVKAGAYHVLVITDGMNTAGPAPEAVLPALQDQAIKSGTPVYFHFVAFDVDAKVFAGVKKLGTTLVSASDETQLTQKLNFILEEKILLEKD